MRHGACSSLSLLFSSSFSLNFSYLQEIIMGRKKLDFIMKLGSIPATKEGLAEKCSLIENRFKKLAAPQAPSADDDIVASLERLSSFSGLGTAIGEEIATLIKAKEHGEDNADDVIAPLDDLGASKVLFKLVWYEINRVFHWLIDWLIDQLNNSVLLRMPKRPSSSSMQPRRTTLKFPLISRNFTTKFGPWNTTRHSSTTPSSPFPTPRVARPSSRTENFSSLAHRPRH